MVSLLIAQSAEEEFASDVGCSQPTGNQAGADLRFGLWAARDLLNQRSPNALKRVLLFTANENPCEDPAAGGQLR